MLLQGLIMTTGFTALQQLTATTGVRFTELAGTMVKYST